jgi:kinetochore protein Mis13/DSN1
LLIVRAANAEPSQSQPLPPKTASHFAFPPPPASQPAPSVGAGPSSQPSKKFKAAASSSSRPRNPKSNSASRDRVAYSGAYDDQEVEKDVRAMEDEVDNLRRHSRAHTTINASLLPSNGSRSKGKEKMADIIIPVPTDDSPQIERNKQLRQGAMDAITGSRGRSAQVNPNDLGRGQRRKSSVGRGKRQSTSFETTGVISKFYVHFFCS